MINSGQPLWSTLREYTEEEIISACSDAVNGWDKHTLLNYAFDNLADYYLNCGDYEALELFMEGEDINV